MSVPATNAFSPAPVRTRTRISSCAATCSQTRTSASYIAHVIALRASGRLNVTHATAPRCSYNTCPVPVSICAPFIGDPVTLSYHAPWDAESSHYEHQGESVYSVLSGVSGGSDRSPCFFEVADKGAHHHTGRADGGVRQFAVGISYHSDVEVHPGFLLNELADEHRRRDRPRAISRPGAPDIRD